MSQELQSATRTTDRNLISPESGFNPGGGVAHSIGRSGSGKASCGNVAGRHSLSAREYPIVTGDRDCPPGWTRSIVGKCS